MRILPQALPDAQPAVLHVEVPENYGGNFPLYLTKVSLTKVYLTTVGCPPQIQLASLTSSTPFPSCSGLLLNPALWRICNIACMTSKILIPEESRSLS